MMRGPVGPLADPPADGPWDFGGYPYGLEPLLLPPVDAVGALADRDPVDGYSDACGLIGELAGGAAAPEHSAAPDELFWFRWITGHQVCFALWRLMGQLLDEIAEGDLAVDEAITPLSRYVDGYSAMLLYTGSCTREVYQALIRPSMRLRHRAFSGSWAPDYLRVRDLLRGRRLARLTGGGPSELDDAVRLHDRVHDGIAAKLVPDGRSLLTQAPVRRLNHGLTGMIYDSYFMTTRAPVTRAQVVGQLLRRLAAIARDLTANGLHAWPDDPLPDELRQAEVVRCATGMPHLLVEVARAAGGPAHRQQPVGTGVAKAAGG